MATLPNENEGLIDGMPRDKRGNWQPEGGPNPPIPSLPGHQSPSKSQNGSTITSFHGIFSI